MDLQMPVGLVLCGDFHEAQVLIELCYTLCIKYWTIILMDIYFLFLFKEEHYDFIRYFILCRSFTCSTI